MLPWLAIGIDSDSALGLRLPCGLVSAESRAVGPVTAPFADDDGLVGAEGVVAEVDPETGASGVVFAGGSIVGGVVAEGEASGVIFAGGSIVGGAGASARSQAAKTAALRTAQAMKARFIAVSGCVLVRSFSFNAHLTRAPNDSGSIRDRVFL